MNKASRNPILLPRLVAEVLIIVLGVLIAIGIDSLRQEYQDRETEREILQSLIVDIEVAEVSLQNLMRRDQETLDGAERVTNGGPSALLNIKSSEAFNGLFNTFPVEIRLRTYEEISQSGNVKILSNRKLRLLLTDFDFRAKSIAGYDRQLEVQWNETARPLTYKIFPFELFAYMESPRTDKSSLIDPTPRELLQMYNAIIDRGNFAAVHLNQSESLKQLLQSLKQEARMSLKRIT
jgi:hypothetical protein